MAVHLTVAKNYETKTQKMRFYDYHLPLDIQGHLLTEGMTGPPKNISKDV